MCQSDDEKPWYKMTVSRDEAKVKKQWKDIKLANELKSDEMNHKFAEVKLTFDFPFFGRVVDSLSVSTAGALIFTARDAEVPTPSHIAPLLSSLPPGHDDILFVNDEDDDEFTAQWTKHYLHNDRVKQVVQVKLTADGRVVFLYHNLLAQLLDQAEETGYPIVIGMQDGFAQEDNDDDSGKRN